ncbi:MULTISPECIES: HlyD family efflux transporter periplasmic adaptor subunit [Asaia]|uniref:Colicin V secretion protein n=1 Tax=Asaia bogorensis TaxID=91915 RepID=A0A060QLM9_9PROT|nr:MULTISPECIES: HlyD family efflux transporter periplasmic adaptor subunit [Asaia]ETC99242.1 anibiotic ABC transporter [Asaia sp. SF2.1]CDG40477.1 colicin V secretion protein [Asaia bogorensis]
MSQVRLFRDEVTDRQGSQLYGGIQITMPSHARAYFAISLVTLLAATTLLFFGHYTRRIQADGLLVPSDGMAMMTSPRGGTVQHIRVNIGKPVAAGEELLAIADDTTSEHYGDTAQHMADELIKQRTSYQAEIVREEQSLDINLHSLRQQISDIEKRRVATQNEIIIDQAQISLEEHAVKRWASLERDGFASRLTLEREITNLLSAKTNINAAEGNLAALDEQAHSVAERLKVLPFEGQSKVDTLRRAISQIDQTMLRNELSRSIAIKAQVSGTVSALLIKEGQSVTPGQALVAVVPNGAILHAELLVQSQSVGFIKIGERVSLHYHAFPFQKFGVASGVVVGTSKSALDANEVTQLLGGKQLPSTDTYYLIYVNIPSQSVVAYGTKIALLSGMSLDAQVHLDRRTIIEWLMDPLIAAEKTI